MSNYVILRQAILGAQHKPTGKTYHFAGRSELPAPSILQIARYPDDPGYYLLYLDRGGNELTDTYRDTIDGELAQAKWEFEIQPKEWHIL